MPLQNPSPVESRVRTPREAVMTTRIRLAWGWRAAVLLFAVWFLLAGATAWPVGVAVAVAGGALGAWLAPGEPHPWRPWRLVPFAMYFARASLQGGVDVARRALGPRMVVAPCFAIHPVTLPAGQPRTLLLGITSLLPGTLSADLDPVRNELLVHGLSPEALETVPELEARIARLFGLDIIPASPRRIGTGGPDR